MTAIWTKLRRLPVQALSGFAAFGIVHWRLRNHLLRLAGWKIGAQVSIQPGLYSSANTVVLLAGSRIGRAVYFDDIAPITIGPDAVIGAHGRLLTRTHPIETGPLRRKAGHDIDLPLTIGRGCWLGVGVTVLPGVRIAEGCVIGAGSLVTRSTEPNGLYAGVPARRIRDLPLEPQGSPEELGT